LFSFQFFSLSVIGDLELFDFLRENFDLLGEGFHWLGELVAFVPNALNSLRQGFVGAPRRSSSLSFSVS
jgi:hypothetical protein